MSSLGDAAATALPGDGAGASGDDGPPSKRRRVALACNACRTRKSRCNGERPKCGLCTNLGFDCQYEPAESSTNIIVRKEFVSDFETRLKSVEDLLKRHDDLLTGHLAACSTPAEKAETEREPEVEAVGRRASKQRKQSEPVAVETDMKLPPLKNDNSIKLKSSDLQDMPPEELVTDGMAMVFADENDYAYFGPSSNISFERHILRAMVAHNITNPKTFSVSHGGRALHNSGMLNYASSPTPPSSSPPGHHASIPGQHGSIPGHHGSLPGGRGGSIQSRHGSLPSRHGSLPSSIELPAVDEMEGLIGIYFLHCGLLFPFMHEPSFMEAYEDFKKTNFSKVRRSWLGLLFVMLAMASVVDPNNKEPAPVRFEKSRLLNERGAQLCRFASLRGSSLENVQYLLLASQYLQSTQKSSQTWMLHGLAVKEAFAIGLHSNQASYSALQNEMRNRTWYGCVLLDRALSMTFGRPPLIPEDYIRVSMARPWPDGPRPSGPDDDLQAPSLDFWNASITMHRLIGCTVSRMYGNNLGWDDDYSEYDLLQRMVPLDNELQQWYRDLPPSMSILISTDVVAPHSQREMIVLRFRTMLTLRVHNLAILIRRPILSRSLDVLAETSGGAPTAEAISERSRQSNDICLGSAEETINMVHAILTDSALGPHALGAWWFTLFYIFNASLVVFSYSHIKRTTLEFLDGQTDPQDLRHLQNAIDTLTLLDTDNRIVNRCIEYVQYLYKVLDRWNSRHSSGSSEQQLALTQQDSGLGELPVVQKAESRHPSASEGPLMPSIFSGLDNEMRDMSDYLKDDLELAQFFASGLFDMQNSVDMGL